MKYLRRKLILSIVALATIVVCFTSTTFAWFARNSYAYIDNFEIEIENYDGLLISIDNEHFTSHVGNSELKKAIIAKTEGKDINDPTLTSGYIESQFLNYKFADVTTNDLKNFKEVDSKNATNGYYDFKEANKYHYIQFDLYFKMATYGNDKTPYDLLFLDDNTASVMKVSKSFIESEDVTAKAITPFSYLVGDTFKIIEEGETLKFNPKNAMRVGLYNINKDETFVYEPNLGISSYALEGGSGIHNPNANLAFQYANSYSKYDLAPLKKTESDTFDYENTHKDFADEVVLGSFENNGDGYNIIKLEMSIWLEGYDGDYIAGASLKPIRCYFSFYKKSRI